MGVKRYCGVPTAVVVVVATTLINIIYGGSYYCSGLLFYHWLHTYGQSRARTAMIVSIMNGMMYATGLISGPLTMQYGPRPVAAAGAILSSLGLFISVFAQKLWVLYISYGLLTGFGWGCLLTTGAVSVQQHTNKRRALAAGISFTGTALGNLTYPLMFRLLESTFGWRGSLMIMAGLQLNCFPAALLFLPPPPSPAPSDTSMCPHDCEKQALTSTALSPGEGPGDAKHISNGQVSTKQEKSSPGILNKKLSSDALEASEEEALLSTKNSPASDEQILNCHTSRNAGKKQTLCSIETSAKEEHVSELEFVQINGKVPRTENLNTHPASVDMNDMNGSVQCAGNLQNKPASVLVNGDVSGERKPCRKSDAEHDLPNQGMNEKVLLVNPESLIEPTPDANLEQHHLQHQQQHQEQQNMNHQFTNRNCCSNGSVTLPHQSTSTNGVSSEKHIDNEQEQKDNCCSKLKMKLVKVAKDGKHRLGTCGLASLACVIAYICRYSGMSVLYSFLPMKVVSVGLPPDTAAYLMSVLSMGELVGRIGVTVTAWLHNRLPVIYFVVAAILAGILEAVIGQTQTLTAMVVVVSVLGINAGILSCIASTVVRDTVGITNLPWVLGLAYGASGIGNLASIQLLAWIWQETDNISVLFLIAGAALMCAGLSFIVYHACCRPRKANRSKTS